VIRRGLTVLLFLLTWGIGAQPVLVIRISGIEGRPNYGRDLLAQALKAAGYFPRFELVGEYPSPRREAMLADGRLSVSLLGQTPERDAKFLAVRVGVTDNLMGKRLLFITKGSQKDYDKVKTLDDLRRLGKVAGVGSSWADGPIWAANRLPSQGIEGNWKVLYSLVASGKRGVDYLPRSVMEIAAESGRHPELDVEQNLMLVYPADHILYVSPQAAELKGPLEKALVLARDSGLIKRLVVQKFPEVFSPSLGLDRRIVIPLALP